MGPHRLCDRRRDGLCRPAGRDRGRTLRKPRLALFLPARPVHDGNRPQAQRQGSELLRPAGAEHGAACPRPAQRTRYPRAARRHPVLHAGAVFAGHAQRGQPRHQVRRAEPRGPGRAQEAGRGGRDRRPDQRRKRRAARLRIQPPHHLCRFRRHPRHPAQAGRRAGRREIRTAEGRTRRPVRHPSGADGAHGPSAPGGSRRRHRTGRRGSELDGSNKTEMRNLWSDEAAEKLVAEYAAKSVSSDLALRVYTTRLLGGEPRLVLHGGGNTSLKTKATDILGHDWDVLCVKGSGWDMALIEPAGLPAVKLQPLLEARKLDRLSDEDMVAMQRANLLDPFAPNPSIETLLHAFLPHRFVDHTHSTAILALVDQVDSEPICREVFGSRLGFVPYIKPGFDLARAAADIYDADPSVEGLILDKHGIFTFADTARAAYELMIEFVTMAEERVAKGKRPFTPVKLPASLAMPAEVAPLLRGAIAIPQGEGSWGRMVSDFRTSPAILEYVNADNAEELARRGVSTPDLSIRIKTGPMVLPAPESGKLDDYANVIRERVAEFSDRYRRYF